MRKLEGYWDKWKTFVLPMLLQEAQEEDTDNVDWLLEAEGTTSVQKNATSYYTQWQVISLSLPLGWRTEMHDPTINDRVTLCVCARACMRVWAYLDAGCHRHGRWYRADSPHRWDWFLPYSPSCFQRPVRILSMNMQHRHAHTHQTQSALSFVAKQAHDTFSFRHSNKCNSMMTHYPLQSYIRKLSLGLQLMN